PVQPCGVVETPAWTPRFLQVSAAPDDFGRRLTEPKSERGHQAKPRTGQKGRGRDQRAPSETSRRREGGSKVAGQPPVMRSRRMPGAKGGASDGEIGILSARDGIQQTTNTLPGTR